MKPFVEGESPPNHDPNDGDPSIPLLKYREDDTDSESEEDDFVRDPK